MRENLSLFLLLGSALVAGPLGCNVESKAKDTGGVPDAGDPGTVTLPDGGVTAKPCPRGVTLVSSDFATGASQVSLLSLAGEVQSASFASTGSAETQGLAFAFSSDVALPSSAPVSGRIVVLDRLGTNVISWFDPATAESLGQLPVGKGFESNPYDYLEVSDRLAFVTRYGQNFEPGAEPFDSGGDVLVIDTQDHEIVGSIELPVEDDFPPSPTRMLRLGDRVLVMLERLASDYSGLGEAKWASISIEDQEVEWVEPIPEHKNCGRPVLSPNGQNLAVACAGQISWDGIIEDLGQSAILIFDATTDPPRRTGRFRASDLVDEPIQSDVVYASSDVVLFKTYMPSPASPQRWLSLNLKTAEVTELAVAAPDTWGYGGMLCTPGCSDLCLLADADRGVLLRARVRSNGNVEPTGSVELKADIELPPRGLSLR